MFRVGWGKVAFRFLQLACDRASEFVVLACQDQTNRNRQRWRDSIRSFSLISRAFSAALVFSG